MQRFARGGWARETLSQGFYPKAASGHRPSKCRLVSIRFCAKWLFGTGWLMSLLELKQHRNLFLWGLKNDSGRRRQVKKQTVSVLVRKINGTQKGLFLEAITDKSMLGNMRGNKPRLNVSALSAKGSVWTLWLGSARLSPHNKKIISSQRDVRVSRLVALWREKSRFFLQAKKALTEITSSYS